MNKKTLTWMRVLPFGVLGLSVLVALIFEEVRLRSTKSQMNTIAELLAGHGGEFIVENKDSWGTNFEVQNLDDSIRIVSAGPDKVINTADDIIGKWHGRKKIKLEKD